MSDSDNIRKYMKIVEGEFIPGVKQTLRLPMFPYELSELVKRLANPDSYTRSNTKGKEAILMFYDPIEYERVKGFLRHFGVDFSEEAVETNKHDDELAEDPNGKYSPFPSNKSIQKHEF